MRFSIVQRLFLLLSLIALGLTSIALVQSANLSKTYFVVRPYVQLGYHFKGNNLTVSWLSGESQTNNLVFEYKKCAAPEWIKSPVERQDVHGHPELSLLSAEMTDLPAACSVSYRICKARKVIFSSAVQSLPAANTPLNFAVLGDVGLGSTAQAQVAAQMKKKQPDMAIIVGDIVYPIGTVSNYLSNFFPYLNEDGGKAEGSALLQSTLSVAVVGNHDLISGKGVDATNLDTLPDSLAYFTLWKEPLNGPFNGTANVVRPHGSKERIDEFLKAAGEAYPRMANFSYDFGACHILALDGNKYMDWTDEKLRQWVDADLKGSKARWKIVVFHQPGFNSDFAHREEQRMRHLCDIFEQDGVDICFAGHSHSYQRSCPLHFKEIPAPASDHDGKAGFVNGTFKYDRSFDGVKNCKPDGIVYVVTGAGGAKLSAGNLESEQGQWLPFTKVFSSTHHSFTLCHVDSRRFAVEQIGEDGSLLDQYAIVK